MKKFTQKIVQMMKDEKLFESQGGPIILSQVWYFLVKSNSLLRHFKESEFGEVALTNEPYIVLFYSIYNLFLTYSFNIKIENEYEREAKAFGAAGHAYMTWAAKMAVEMDTGVPWVMCKEIDAPDPVVSRLISFQVETVSYSSNYTSLNKSLPHFVHHLSCSIVFIVVISCF